MKLALDIVAQNQKVTKEKNNYLKVYNKLLIILKT